MKEAREQKIPSFFARKQGYDKPQKISDSSHCYTIFCCNSSNITIINVWQESSCIPFRLCVKRHG